MSTYQSLKAFADIKRLIVVAAHPDDLETMCGGTIAQLIQQGVTVFSVNCTLGDIGTQQQRMFRANLASIRLGETTEAADFLGISNIYSLGYPDGELVNSLVLRAEIARLYRLTQADALFTFDPFWSGQVHPDHRAAGQAALDAYLPAKMPLYHPEQLNEKGANLGCLEHIFFFATDKEANVYVDVTDVYETKLQACIHHHSQFPNAEQDLNWLKDLDKHHGQKISVSYAEAFKRISVW